MYINEIVKMLVDKGLDPASAKAAAQEINRKEDRRARVTHAKNWDRVLAPLLQDIRIKSSTMSRWSKDPIRGPVYSAYLDMLRKVRDDIKSARILNLHDKTIPEIAAERNLSGDGLRWVDWVPRKVHSAFLLAFDKMHSHPDLPRRGKRMLPFITTMERSASDTRWDRIATSLVTDIAGREGMPEFAPLNALMTKALDAIYARGIADTAPAIWEQLLTKEDRQALEEWKRDSLNGLRVIPLKGE